MLTAEPPLKVRSAEGAYLELEDGRKILDCISSWWVNIHGHAHPEIAAAIYRQAQELEQVIFAGFTHEPAEKLAELLIEALPEPLSHMFFSDNGSTAVEVALKLAFQYYQNQKETRRKFIAFEGGYHGDTVGSMSIGQGSPFWKKFSPLLFSIELIPFPCTYEDNGEGGDSIEIKEKLAIAAIKKVIAENKKQVAAICIEPLVQGAAGMRMCRPEFLRNLKEITEENDMLLIFDEVMTGFGRTGDFFAATKSGVCPDMLCLSKGITGGFLPLSVTVTSNLVFDAFLDSHGEKTFYHGHSYTANPLACAAAIKSWQLLNENKEQFQTMEALHRKLASYYLAGHKSLKQRRFCGTIFACEIESPEGDHYFNSLSAVLKKRFIEKGCLIRPLGNTIYLMPPYCIGEEALSKAYAAISDLLSEL